MNLILLPSTLNSGLALLVMGLNPWDLAIVLLFLVAILTVGIVVSATVHKQSDFYLGGRKLGPALQFFLNFGNSTDSTGAVSTSREIYRVGAEGIWLTFQTLFITPFFWFTQPWFRRVRLITMADLFVDRFNSKGLATAYAGFNIVIALITLAYGNIATYAVTAAMVQKSQSSYTIEEQRRVADYSEYEQLKMKRIAGELPAKLRERFQFLENLNAIHPLEPGIAYIGKVPFLIGYSAAVAMYITLGGLKAAAVTDAIQGVLILVMSVLLIPLGLYAVGGFHALHAAVPAFKFNLVGDPGVSEYAWFSILAITFTSLIQIMGLMHNMSMGGSARNEDTARFGMISGGFGKRLVIIAWTLCSLLALGILGGSKAVQPDAAWGTLSRRLLPPGLMGLMLSGTLLGHMPSVGVASVSASALALRNLYVPLMPNRSQRHYLLFGQLAVGVVLGVGICGAMMFQNINQALTMMITFNTYFGAVVLLLFFWRRLTPFAISAGLFIWIVVMGILPWGLPHIAWFSQRPSLLAQTPLRHVVARNPANESDVTRGLASKAGELIEKPTEIPPRPLYFESIVRLDPKDAHSARVGMTRFNIETFSLHLLGMPVENFSPAGSLAARWGFDGLLPFVLLVTFSLVTPLSEPERADRFYAKLKTPVAATPELDAIEVNKSFENPRRFDHLKLFPGSSWEFTRWCGKDFIGFFGCWLIVGAILLLLRLILQLGA